MVGENLNGHTGEGAHYFTLHDFLAIGFRRRQLIVTTFLGILVLGVLVALLLPTQYESQMKILVRRERADSMVSPNREPAYVPLCECLPSPFATREAL